MTSELTERTTIERLAIELGWAVNQGVRWTAFGRDGHTLTAWWSDNRVAYHATLSDSGTRKTIPRNLFEGNVGEWVLDRLREFGACPQIQDIETSPEASA